MPFDRYQLAVARATRLLRRKPHAVAFPQGSRSNLPPTVPPCRHVVHWLCQHWQEMEAFDESDVTAEILWQLSGELFRMNAKLVLVFAKVSGKDTREIVETLQDAVMWAPFLDLDWRPGCGQIRPCKATKLSKEKNN